MWSDSVRTSVFGRLVYRLSNYKYFAYPEEQPDYEIPKEYLDTENQVVIDWEEGDPTHPRNWPFSERLMVQTQMTLLTFVAYMGGPIYAPAMMTIQEEFNVGYVVSTFPMCFFILGYGISQMYFSPMSEQPNIGRTPIYSVIGALFAIFQIPCALSTNITGLVISRFITGIFASPAQSVGAASYADVTHLPYIPVALVLWGLAAFSGPSTGPIVAVGLMKSSWRNIFWFMFATNGFMTLWLFVASPETNDQTLLYWKAQRLRRVTGNSKIVASCELNEVSTANLLATISVRAFEIMATEPVVFLMDIYQALTYGCVYLWFECFPIVYGEMYHFTLASEAAAYNSINVGVILGGCLYVYILYHTFSKKILNGEAPRPKAFLDTSFLGCVFLILSMFIFGWTSSPKIHWFPSLIGATLFGAGSVCVLQSNINYLSVKFPRYIASVLAGNGLCRALVGSTIPMYGRQMFKNLAIKDFPVGWGSSLIGFLFIGFAFIPLSFKKYGDTLNRNSKFAGP